jgi:hypothetical protein
MGHRVDHSDGGSPRRLDRAALPGAAGAFRPSFCFLGQSCLSGNFRPERQRRQPHVAPHQNSKRDRLVSYACLTPAQSNKLCLMCF